LRVVTGQEMKEIDAAAIAGGLPGTALMEAAGAAAAKAAVAMLGADPERRRVVILCGTGNNGGDGLVAARYLLNRKIGVQVFLAAAPDRYKGDAARFYAALRDMAGCAVAVAPGVDALHQALSSADLIIDAMLGTGIRGAPGEPYNSWIRMVNALKAAGRAVLSLDIPSGVEADTGAVPGEAVRADTTITFALPKLGLLLYPGAAYTGRLEVADIGIPYSWLESWDGGGESLMRRLITAEEIASLLRRRPANAHKGHFGKVAVVAGSQGMAGAAELTVTAALRGGAGLVTWVGPASLWPVMATKLTEATTSGLAEDAAAPGCLGTAAVPAVIELMAACDVLALGPGLGRRPATLSFVREVCAAVGKPIVVDADALYALPAERSVLAAERRKKEAPWVLTPHPGEAAHLLGQSIAEVEKDRVGAALALARGYRCIAVLKGVPTLVADAEGRYLFLNSTGNPGMATGGSGDCLTGLVAAFLAQGMAPLKAAEAAVYFHGRAGDLAAEQKGITGLTAGDIAAYLPAAIKTVWE